MSPSRADAPRECAWTPRVLEYARGELRGREQEELERHLESCAACTAELADTVACLGELESAIATSDSRSRFEPPPDFERRVLENLPTRRVPPRAVRFAAVLAAAACLLFAVAFSLSLFHRREASSRRVAEADSLSRAVTWLVAAQEPEGGWDPSKWNGSARYRVGVSGLAVMALAGSSDRAVGEPLARGVSFLLASQGANGLFGPEFPGSNYNQGIATLALLRVRGMAGGARLDPPIDRAIDRAISCLLERQLPSGAWGYSEEASGGSSAVTVWPLQALALAKAGGREDAARAVDRGLAWLERSLGGDGSISSSPDDAGMHVCGVASGPAFKALAVLLRGAGARGRSEATSRETRRAFDGVARALGSRKANDDPLESYFLTRVLEAQDAPPLGALRAAARKAIASRQVASGPLAGTWEPVGRWSPAGGRLCTTALAALALEPRDGKF